MIRRNFLSLLCLIISAISYDARGADACEVTITTFCNDTYYASAAEVCSRCPQLGYDSSGNAVYQTGGADNTGKETSCKNPVPMPTIKSCHRGYYFENGTCKKCELVIGYTSNNERDKVIGTTNNYNTGGSDSCTIHPSNTKRITYCPTNWKFVENNGLNTSICERCPDGMVTSKGPHNETECKTQKEQSNCSDNQYLGTDGAELPLLTCIDCPVVGWQNGVEIHGITTKDTYMGIDSCVAPAGTYTDENGNTFVVPDSCYVETGEN